MAACNNCGEEIEFQKTGEIKPDGKPKFRPVNPGTNTPHRCKGSTPAAKPATPSTAQEGILVSAQGNGVTIRTEAKGDRTYAVSGMSRPICSEDELPQRVMFTLQDHGFVIINSYLGPVDIKPLSKDIKTAPEIKAENVDRMSGPADGECVVPPGGQLITPPAATANTCTSSSQAATGIKITSWSGTTTFHIECTINLEHYENIKAGIECPIPDAEQGKSFLKDQLLSLGGNHEPTREMIRAYVRRVF